MTTLDLALEYVGMNLAVFPVPYGRKAPGPTGWPATQATEESARALFNGARQNIAINLGEQSAGATDVDLDCPEAIELGAFFLPPTFCFGRASARRAHWIYKTDLAKTTDTKAIEFHDVDGAMIAELRIGANGHAASCVFPGSVHESGEPVVRENDLPIAVIDGAALKHRVALLAACVLLARHWPAQGARHEAELALNGFLRRSGIPAQDFISVAHSVVAAATPYRGVDHRDATRQAIKTISDDKPLKLEKTPGYHRLAEIFGEAVASRVADWLEYSGSRDPENVISLPVKAARKSVKSAAPPRAGDGFLRSQGGQILRHCHENSQLALSKLGVTVRYNEFSGDTELSGLPPHDYLADAAEVRLRFLVGETFDFRPDVKLFRDVLIDTAHRNKYHPVRDILAALVWDGVPRIDNWLRDYAGAEDTPFNRAVGRIWLIAGVRRVRRPGCKFDTLPVLESPEGKNKSEGLRVLATRNEWFLDCLELGASPKDVIEQTRGAWIVECGELDGLKTREEGKIKAFLSRQVEKARPAYGHFAERVERQFLPVGTTNEAEWLKTEGRRYWPVPIRLFDLSRLARDIHQLWAEAARYEEQDESIVLPEALWPVAAEVRDRRVIANLYQEKLSEPTFSR